MLSSVDRYLHERMYQCHNKCLRATVTLGSFNWTAQPCIGKVTYHALAGSIIADEEDEDEQIIYYFVGGNTLLKS